eukprot:1235187-Pyramimonas_sp.AAC.2
MDRAFFLSLSPWPVAEKILNVSDEPRLICCSRSVTLSSCPGRLYLSTSNMAFKTCSSFVNSSSSSTPGEGTASGKWIGDRKSLIIFRWRCLSFGILSPVSVTSSIKASLTRSCGQRARGHDDGDEEERAGYLTGWGRRRGSGEG